MKKTTIILALAALSFSLNAQAASICSPATKGAVSFRLFKHPALDINTIVSKDADKAKAQMYTTTLNDMNAWLDKNNACILSVETERTVEGSVTIGGSGSGGGSTEIGIRVWFLKPN